VNYDESDDEDDVDLKAQGSSLPLPSAVLPVEQDDEVDLCSDELAEILADGPISCVKKSKGSEGTVGMEEVEEEVAGGVFELADWV